MIDTSSGGIKARATPAERKPPAAGAWCGIAVAVAWAPMAAVIPLFPDLDSRTEVVAFWDDHGALTLRIMALVVLGYPFLLVFLADVAARASGRGGRPVLSWAALAAGVMFMTGLCAALGLAAAAGRIVEESTEPSAAYALHVGAFVLAAPFTGSGVAFFVFVALLSQRGHLQPRWLRWPALLGILGNVGAVAGLFTLTGPGNSGNGLLGGILLPLGTFLIWTACASLGWLRNARRSRPRNAPGR